MKKQPISGMNYNTKIELDFSDKISLAAKEKKTLNKPFRTPGGPKKFAVYVKNEKGNVVKLNFGDPNMEIKRDDPNRRKNFRARHQCDTNPGPKWKARYWSCRMWESNKSVTDYIKASIEYVEENWNGETLWEEEDLIKEYPQLQEAPEVENEAEDELEDYKEEFYGMSVGSLKSIKAHVDAILNALSDEKIKENLTEPFLQAKIALAEDYMLGIHNYVMFAGEEEQEGEDEEMSSEAVEKAKTKKFDAEKMQPSTLDKKVLNELEKISKKIAPPEEGHEGKNGESEDKQEYQKRAELFKG